MSKIEIKQDLLPLVGRTEDVLDGITGFVEHYDFSKANSSYEARVQAVTKIASICYANAKALGSVSLFDRLQAESAGLPSSSYEFVPVLLDWADYSSIVYKAPEGETPKVLKFGEWLSGKREYILTNLRGLIEDVGPEESLNYLNTSDEEIQIIRDNFKVFLFNVDVPTRTQMIRHRISWQELSRRYVSGKKKEFEFYVSKKMESVVQELPCGEETDGCIESVNTSDLIDMCVEHYYEALAQGVKPEEARRILPQAMMTQIWGAFQPKQLEGFFKLRLDAHSQLEIRNIAEAMKGLLDDPL